MDIKKAKVYVHGTAYYRITAQTFQEQGKYEITKDLDEAQICCWTGGKDINPAIYGEKPLTETYFDSNRDFDDLQAVKQAVEQKKFLVGICRGAQLLNCVPNGGTLWQDVDGHESTVHRVFDCVTGSWILLNSIHHQQMRVTNKAQILAWSQESTVKKSQNQVWHKPLTRGTGGVVSEKDKDVEACWYSETESLLIQGHPEFGHKQTTDYFFGLLEKFYWLNQQQKVA